MEMAREIKAMGIKLCCRWFCLLWVMPGKLVGGGGATTLCWVGSSLATSRVASAILGWLTGHPMGGWSGRAPPHVAD
jgi:hypothetical protein